MTKVATTTLRSLAGFIAVAASAPGGAPTTVHWAAPVSGDWSQAASWSPALVPDNASGGLYHAVIDAPGAPYTVTVQALSPTLDAVTIDAAGASLIIGDGSILETDALRVLAGTIAVHQEASLVVTGEVTCAGLIECIESGAEASFTGPSLWTNDGAVSATRGAITITAPVVINNGLLSTTANAHMQINASFRIINEGRLRTGAHGGSFNILNDLQQGPSAAIIVGIKTVFPPDMTTGSIEIMGAAALDGALEVYEVNDNGINPVPGNDWDVLFYASRTGDFTSFSFPELANPEHVWWAEPAATKYTIGVRHIADLDHDGFIGFVDLNILIGNFNAPGAPARGDIDGDGFVGFADLNALLSRFGQSAW